MMFLLVVTLTSMLLAAIMSVVAWRISGDERRRSEARVAVLAAEIHDASPSGQAVSSPQPVGRVLLDPPLWDPPLSRVPKDPAYTRGADRAYTRVFAVLAGGALVVCAAVGIALLASGRFPDVARLGRLSAAAPAPAAPPLELVALGHERVGDQLTVRGVVRNPSSGAGVDRLTAVVLLFTPDGGYVASGRAAVASPALRPGSESTFVVTVPGAADAGRYRVSFRADDHIVPHLDRRHES